MLAGVNMSVSRLMTSLSAHPDNVSVTPCSGSVAREVGVGHGVRRWSRVEQGAPVAGTREVYGATGGAGPGHG